jgi:hypothetical protein
LSKLIKSAIIIRINIMSKLFKSKFFLGALIVTVLAIGGVTLKATPASADCSTGTTTLRLGSRGSAVMCLQQTLNAHGFTVSTTGAGSMGMESTYFGTKTKMAVMAMQASLDNGLAIDGIFGAHSRASLLGSPSGNFPPGCNSASGYSTTTGMPCSSLNANTFAPTGCTSASGFSPVTGGACYAVNSNVQTGPVSAMLASDNPAAGNIIQGQATADLLHIALSGTGTVTSMTFQRTGISTSSDLTNVYLYDGITRLSDGASVNTNGVIVFNGLNISVSGTKMISVKADISSTATTGSIGVTMTAYMVAGGSAQSVNIVGNQMYVVSAPSTMVSYTVGTVTPAACTSSCPTVNAGTTAYTFWSAPIQVNNHSAILKSAAFRYIGSAPYDALGNIKLYVNGTSIGTTTINAMGYAVFDFSAAPVTLNTGSSTIEVRADVQKGTNRTVQFTLQNASDLMITDPQLGVNIAATSGIPAPAATVTISAGSVTVSIDPAFQSLTNITGGSTNVTIAKFKVHAYGEDVKVQSLAMSVNMNLTGAASGTGMNNVTLYFNGSQVGSSQSFTGTGTVALTAFQLGSSMIIPAGIDSTLEVHADAQSSTSSNYTGGTVSVTLPAGTTNGQGQNSLTTIAVPAAAITSNSLTAQTGLMSLSASSSYLSQTMNPNTANAKIGSFILQNQSTSESVRVTSLQVGLTLPAATTFVLAGSTTNVTTTQTWVLNQTAALAGITAGNVLTLAANVGCTTVPVITVASVSGSTLTSVSTGQTASNLNTCTLGTAVVAVSPTVGPAALTNFSNLKTSEASGSGATPINPTATNNFSVDFTIAPGATKTIDIMADLGTANMGTVKSTLIITAQGSTSNVALCSPSITGGSVNGCNTSTALSGQTITLGSGSVNTPTVVTSSTTASQFVPGGTTTGVTDVTKATFNLTATNGSATISELKFKNTGTSGTLTAVRVGTHTAPTVTDIAYLTGLAIAVPNGGAGTNIDAFGSYAPVGPTGVTSGGTSVLQLCSVRYTIGGTTTTAGDTTCASPLLSSGTTMTLVGSSPTVTVAQPTGAVLAVGNIEAIDVTVKANAQGPITLNAFSITSSLSANTSTNSTFAISASNPIVVKDANNAVVTLAGASCGSTAANINCFFATSGGGIQVKLASGYLINAGEQQTFKVFLPVATIGTGTSINNMFSTPTDGSGLTTSNNYFSWTDTAGSASAAQTGTSNIYNFPTTFTSTVHN